MNLIYILIIIVISVYCSYIPEKYINTSYSSNYEFEKCCRHYGCRNNKCKDIIKNNLGRTPLLRIGVLESTVNQKKIPLYMINNDKINRYYYVEPIGKHFSKFIELDTKHNYKDLDKITVKGDEYSVKYYGDESYNKHFVPLWPELMTAYPYSSMTPVPYYYPKEIYKGFHYIGRLVTYGFSNGRPLGNWNINKPEFYLYGKPLSDGITYTYIVGEKRNGKLVPIWFFKRTRYLIGDHLFLRKSNRHIGPLFLIP